MMAKAGKKNGVFPRNVDRSLKSPRRPTVHGSDIARRAYDFYLARGCQHGHDVEDWLLAERELKKMADSTV
jgi:Protein of unknown function (DUF2934)